MDLLQLSGRRKALKLGIAAVLAALARPLTLRAESQRLELRYYRNQGGKSKLIYAEPLAAPVVDELLAGDLSEIEMKWYDGRGGLLGIARLPAELRAKLEAMRS